MVKNTRTITWDYLKLTMEFMCGTQRVMLIVSNEFKNQVPGNEKCQGQITKS